MKIASMRKFVAKYNGFIVLFGALIVAATFAVKDAWREKLKDDSDTANSTINILLMRDDSLKLSDDLHGIQKDLARVQASLGTKQTTTGQATPTKKPDEPLDDPTLPIFHVLNNLDEFANSYPCENVWKKLTEFSKELATLEETCSQYKENEGTGQNPENRMGLFLKCRLGSSALLTEIEAYKVSILANSLGIRAQKRKEYEHATRYGYLLFSLGLVVSVLPKLLAEKDSEEPDLELMD